MSEGICLIAFAVFLSVHLSFGYSGEWNAVFIFQGQVQGKGCLEDQRIGLGCWANGLACQQGSREDAEISPCCTVSTVVPSVAPSPTTGRKNHLFGWLKMEVVVKDGASCLTKVPGVHDGKRCVCAFIGDRLSQGRRRSRTRQGNFVALGGGSSPWALLVGLGRPQYQKPRFLRAVFEVRSTGRRTDFGRKVIDPMNHSGIRREGSYRRPAPVR
ncbi:hypothetical protein GE09DRAFT_147235 [Coniochaeta sp. 2T2.1]|nr:hypothetical protein GE09DRAFT_147235 [Coniochaeta sp. 2T2.1]